MFSKKTFSLSYAASEAVKMRRYLKKKKQMKNQKFLVQLKIYNYFKNMIKENTSLDFRLKKQMKQVVVFYMI